MDDVPVVDVLERERELHEPLHDLLLGHPLVSLLVVLHVAVHVSARAEGHDEAQLVGRLVDEAVLVAADVRVAQPLQQRHLANEVGLLVRLHVEALDGARVAVPDAGVHCPGRKPPFWAVTRPPHPCKTAIQTRLSVESAKGA